jgi:hypothetical protein
MIATLRRAGQFDPVQFFGARLTEINSTLGNPVHYTYTIVGRRRHEAVETAYFIGAASDETECFDARRFVASVTTVAKMSRRREN